VISGGDDNALTLATFSHSPDTGVSLVSTGTVASAHSASVTHLSPLANSHFVSASADQRVNVWSCNPKTATLTLLHSAYSPVADVSTMDTYFDGDKWVVGVSGVGMEMFTLDCLI
jgi:hypothetical protein